MGGLSSDQVQTAAVNLLRMGELQRVLAGLNATHIPVTLLKGVGLLISDYQRDYHNRPMGDTDLLVAPEREADARHVLEELGYELFPSREVVYRRLAAQEYLIDLHTNLDHLDRNGLSLACERSLTVDLSGQPARVFAPDDNFLYIASHMGLHHAYVTPHGLSDLDRLARRHDLDYVRIARRARRHRLEVPVGEVLRILVRRFGTPMPDEFIKALRPRAGGRLAAKAYRKVLSQDRAVHGWGVLLELLFRGSLLDRWRLMRSYVWPGREVIIRRYQLSPDISAWCYHTLRPLRLMRRTRRILSELLHGSAG